MCIIIIIIIIIITTLFQVDYIFGERPIFNMVLYQQGMQGKLHPVFPGPPGHVYQRGVKVTGTLCYQDRQDMCLNGEGG